MANGIFGKLFGKKEAGLSEREQKALCDTLEERYGIRLSSESVSVPALKEAGYRLMHEDEAARANALFQYLPQGIANKLNAVAVQSSFSEAVKGSYKPVLEAGTKLGKSRQISGAASGNVFDSKNHLKGAAAWIQNEAEREVSKAPEIALGVFNVLSVVTGQYFMAQVNGKLSAITSGVERIEQHMNVAERSKLYGAAQELQDLVARIDYTEKDSGKTESAVNQLHEIMRTAQAAINTSRELALNEAKAAMDKDHEKELRRKLTEIGIRLDQYQYAVSLYTTAVLVEMKLRKTVDPDEMETYRSQMVSRVDQYKEDYASCLSLVQAYLEKIHVLNDNKWWEKALGIGVGLGTAAIAPKWFSSIFIGIKAKNAVNQAFTKKREKKKAEIVASTQSVMEPLGDLSTIEAPIQAVDLCAETIRQGVKIVKAGDQLYTTMPEAKEMAAH